MKYNTYNIVLLFQLCTLCVFIHTSSSSSSLHDHNNDPLAAIKSLISRNIPQYSAVFSLQIIDKDTKGDVFELETMEKGIITLRGNNAISMSMGVNHYLKYMCNCQISWTGNQLQLPLSPPSVPVKIRVVVPMKYRYYFNVCTFGYSTAWWDWKRWEKEIDWMALNGINTPLAFVGQEIVWRDVYSSLGISNADINSFFTGPAFLPWNRMGNVNQWGGGLPESWLTGQSSLQKSILSQMRSFGMTPILPAFAGHVPAALSKLYPNANITQLGQWASFDGTYYLAPDDPLFLKIGNAFITRQAQVYGTDHLYNADPFNELIPPSNDPGYLATVSKKVLESMATADNETVWVMQGWFLVNDAAFWKPDQAKAYLTAVPDDRLLMLDLWAEVVPVWNKTEKFYGKNFIWCMLHDFGGRTGIYGVLPSIAQNPVIAHNAAPNMQGIGLTPEAIETNYIVYDLMMEMSWRIDDSTLDLNSWVEKFAVRRYGEYSVHANLAWRVLQDALYSVTKGYDTQSFVAFRPSPQVPPQCTLYHDPASLPIILNSLLYAANSSANIAKQETFSHDIAAVTRQFLSDIFLVYHTSMMNSFNSKDQVNFNLSSAKLLGVIEDLEIVVATQDMWLLGNWIESARMWGTNPSEISLYEFNARNQLTLWGTQTSVLADYAYKLWSGLVSDFYFPRWNLFVSSLGSSLLSGKAFDFATFTKDVQSLEYAWNTKTNPYPTTPKGDAIEIARQMYNKYLPK